MSEITYAGLPLLPIDEAQLHLQELIHNISSHGTNSAVASYESFEYVMRGIDLHVPLAAASLIIQMGEPDPEAEGVYMYHARTADNHGIYGVRHNLIYGTANIYDEPNHVCIKRRVIDNPGLKYERITDASEVRFIGDSEPENFEALDYNPDSNLKLKEPIKYRLKDVRQPAVQVGSVAKRKANTLATDKDYTHGDTMKVAAMTHCVNGFLSVSNLIIAHFLNTTKSHAHA